MIVAGLRADLVPHRQWALRRWFYSGARYYHGPRHAHAGVPFGAGLGPDPELLDLVDDDLRRLCAILLGAGYATTPSCQGHFHSREHLRGTWERLREEEQAIRTTGIGLIDSETGRRVEIRSTDYVLPWSGFEPFFAETVREQQTGYLGVLVPRDRPGLLSPLRRLLRSGPPLEVAADGERRRIGGMALHHVLVEAGDPVAQAAVWSGLADALLSVLPTRCAR